MLPSELFYKRAKQVLKNAEGKNEDLLIAEIRECLFSNLKDLPETLQHDIFNFYYERYLDDPSEAKSLYDLAALPMDMIDFLAGQLKGDELHFSDDEWSMIREGINATADMMDLGLLNRLMAVLVEKKKY